MSLCDRVLGVGMLLQLIVVLLSSRVIVGRRLLAGCVLVYTLVLAFGLMGSWPKGSWRNLVIAAGLLARTWFSASVGASPLRNFASNGSVANLSFSQGSSDSPSCR